MSFLTTRRLSLLSIIFLIGIGAGAQVRKPKQKQSQAKPVYETFLIKPIEIKTTQYKDGGMEWKTPEQMNEPRIIIPCQSIPDAEQIPINLIKKVAKQFGFVEFNENKIHPGDRALFTFSLAQPDFSFKMAGNEELNNILNTVSFFNSRADGLLAGTLEQFTLRVTYQSQCSVWGNGKAHFTYYLNFSPVGHFKYTNKDRGILKDVIFDVSPLESAFSKALRNEVSQIPGAEFYASTSQYFKRRNPPQQ